MSDHDDFETLLKQRFDREHRHVPADPFVAEAMQRIRFLQRRTTRMRIGLQLAGLVTIIAASPWLIDGAARLSAALESSFAWTAGLPGAGVLAVLVGFAILATRTLSR